MKLTKPIGNRTLATVSVSLAIAAVAVHGLNRIFYGVLSSSSQQLGQSIPPTLIFTITLMVIYSMPFALSLFSRESGGYRGWPIREFIAVFIGTFLGVVYVITGEYQDVVTVVGGLLLYIVVILAYSFTIKKGIASWRVGDWGKSLANGGMVLIAAFLILIISWAIVYLE